MEAWFSVLDMSRILSVSESTVYRRMRTYNITKRCYTDIDDEQLDLVLGKILSEFPRCGEQMLRCLLEGKGIKVIYNCYNFFSVGLACLKMLNLCRPIITIRLLLTFGRYILNFQFLFFKFIPCISLCNNFDKSSSIIRVKDICIWI